MHNKIWIWGKPQLKTPLLVNSINSRTWKNTMLFPFPGNLRTLLTVSLPTCAQASLAHLSLKRSTYKLVLMIAWSHQLVLTKTMIKLVPSFLLLKTFFTNEGMIYFRSSSNCMNYLYNFLVIQLIVIYPLTPISTGPSLELTCNNYL